MQDNNAVEIAEIHAKVDAELDRLLIDTARGTVIIIPIATLLLAGLLKSHISLPYLVSWVILMISLSSWRWLIARRYHRTGISAQQKSGQARLYAIFTFITGLCWGLLALLPAALASLYSQAIVYMAAVGVVMIGVNVLVMNRFALISYVTPYPLVLVVALNTLAGAAEWSAALSIMMVTGLTFMLWAALRNHRILRHNLTLRITNEALAERLGISTREAQAASEAKSFFLANMSHEIRTPMNAVTGLTHLLQDTSLNDRQQQLVGAIRTASDSLLGLLNNILDLSKIEAGQLQLDLAVFRLDDLLESISTTMDPLARQQGIELRLRVDRAGLPECVNGDEVRLRQVLTNLVSNAIRFTERGHVTLAVERAQEPSCDGAIPMRFSVVDTGVGIPPEKHALIFENFVQADISTTRGYGGSGLGLAISRQLIELMNGRIWLESAVGQGSAFHFTVSLREGRCPEARRTLPQSVGGSRTLQVLLVEDNDFNRYIIRELLQGRRYRIDEAHNGLEGLQAISAKPYDLVLMDVQMPVMDGITASRVLRAAERGTQPVAELPAGLYADLRQRLQRQHLPVVALTANAMLDDRQACLDAGMDGYLAKPFTPEQLHELIESLVPDSAGAPAE